MFWGWISNPGRKSLANQHTIISTSNYTNGQRGKIFLSVEEEPFRSVQGAKTQDFTAFLQQSGFSEEEVRAFCKLQKWYQNGGSDRAFVLHHLEFLRRLVARGILER